MFCCYRRHLLPSLCSAVTKDICWYLYVLLLQKTSAAIFVFCCYRRHVLPSLCSSVTEGMCCHLCVLLLQKTCIDWQTWFYFSSLMCWVKSTATYSTHWDQSNRIWYPLNISKTLRPSGGNQPHFSESIIGTVSGSIIDSEPILYNTLVTAGVADKFTILQVNVWLLTGGSTSAVAIWL